MDFAMNTLDGRSLSHRDLHSEMTNFIQMPLSGLVPIEDMPTLTLMKKDVDNATLYRYRLDFTKAHPMFGKCEYPIELFLTIISHNLTLLTKKIFITTQPYWDYDNKNKIVRSISFFIRTFKGLDYDYDYEETHGFEDVMLYAHK